MDVKLVSLVPDRVPDPQDSGPYSVSMLHVQGAPGSLILYCRGLQGSPAYVTGTSQFVSLFVFLASPTSPAVVPAPS